MDLFSSCFDSCGGWKKRLKCGNSSGVKATPLPLGKLFAIYSVIFINQFGSMIIFPFLPFMVHDFFPELSKEELGRKAGFLGSAYFIGSLLGSPFWGWVSDIWGRRPVMLMGVVGSICSQLLFGFSQSYAWAITARLMWGLLNGNIGVAKTYLSEVCDDTNQAKGFSIIGMSSGLGRLTGPIIGGFLARPAIKYAIFHHPFFCKFPYVLPVFVAVFIGFISLVSGFLFLEESLPKIKISRAVEAATNDYTNDDVSDIDTDIEMESLTSESESELTNQMVESDIDSQSDAFTSDNELLLNGDIHIHRHYKDHCIKRAIQRMNPITLGRNIIRTQKEQCILCFWCCQGQQHPCTRQRTIKVNQLHRTLFKKLKWVAKAICTRSVLISIILYALMGCLGLIIQEVYPLLMVTDYEHGGYNLDDSEIGTLVMIVGIIQLFYQPIVYPRLAKLFGYRHFYRIGLTLLIVSIILFPWSNAITGPISATDDPSISGSGMVPGSGDGNSTSNLSYCGDTTDTSTVNENSIARLPAKVFAVMLIILAMYYLSSLSAFTSVFVLINNSALPQTKGTVNGVAQSLVAFFRAIGPTVGGLVFAWSENNGLPWPFNYHFIFYLVAICCIGVLLLSCCLPKSVEKKRQSI